MPLKCRYCSFSNVKRLVLWQHCKLCHAHHGPEVPCLAQDGCPHRFKSYTSFKSHYSRIHNKDADKECADGCKIQCIKCNMIVVGLETFLTHLRRHVSSHEYVSFQLLSAKKGKYSDRIRRELAAFEENKVT